MLWYQWILDNKFISNQSNHNFGNHWCSKKCNVPLCLSVFSVDLVCKEVWVWAWAMTHWILLTKTLDLSLWIIKELSKDMRFILNQSLNVQNERGQNTHSKGRTGENIPFAEQSNEKEQDIGHDKCKSFYDIDPRVWICRSWIITVSSWHKR